MPILCRLCQREHTPEQWASLGLVGAQQGAHEGVWLEMRQCLCLTTLSVHISAERAAVVQEEVAKRPRSTDFEQVFRELAGRFPR